MALHYVEYDTNSQAFFADLRAQLLQSNDWARLTADDVLLTTNGASTSTVLPFAATGSGLAVGSIIMIDDGPLREYRTITAMTATTITVAAMSFAHAAGTAIRSGSELYKCTTTRGAQMVVDFSDAHVSVTSNLLTIGVYQSHDGVTPGPKTNRYLYWRSNGGAATHPLHVVLSVGKEHLYISVEGPRAGETGALSGAYGSVRQYFFLCDLVPYDAGDTDPVVVAGGSITPDINASFTNLNDTVQTSMNLSGTGSWQKCGVATLDFPKAGFGDATNYQHVRAIDGKYILAPYVIFANDSGMRGRLSSFFFAGFNVPDIADLPVPPIGTKIEYQGQWYKLLAVSKSEAARHCWGPFGAATQNSAALHVRSPVVAIPCLP